MSVIGFEQSDGIALIRFDDGAKNVVNHEVLDEFEAAWARAEEDASAVVLSGRPGSFCAGYDIAVMTGGDAEASAALGRRGGRLAYRLFGSDVPIVACATGHAFTIGAVWLACCDVRIGERGRYKYGMTEVQLGVPFSAWPLEPLKARLRPDHQVPALLHSKVYDPEGALQAGFIDRLVDEGESLAIALSEAEVLASLPRAAYGASKRELRGAALAGMAADLGITEEER